MPEKKDQWQINKNGVFNKYDELKPCPLCGGEAILVDHRDKLGYVVCDNCGLMTRTTGLASEAVKLWNTRK